MIVARVQDLQLIHRALLSKNRILLPGPRKARALDSPPAHIQGKIREETDNLDQKNFRITASKLSVAAQEVTPFKIQTQLKILRCQQREYRLI